MAEDKVRTVLTYLAGPIDNINTSEAKKWRDMITIELKKCGVEALNPFGKMGGDRLEKLRNTLHDWSIRGNIDAVRSFVGTKVMPLDLIMVEKCDFVTVWIPEDSKEICGTYGETTLAYYLGKPVYIVTNRILKPLTLPKWLVGCSTKVFTSWSDYLNYINEYWAIYKLRE